MSAPSTSQALNRAATAAKTFFKIATADKQLPRTIPARVAAGPALSKSNPNFRAFVPIESPLSGGTWSGLHSFDPHHRPPTRGMSTSARQPAGKSSNVRSYDPSVLQQQLKQRAAARAGGSRSVFPPTKFEAIVSKKKPADSDCDLRLHSFVQRVTAERAAAAPDAPNRSN